jgi:MoxR-like ATPase
MTNAELAAFDQIHTAADRLRGAVANRVVGQAEVVDHLIAAVLVEGHTLLIGPPGLAKTMLVRTLAEALGWDFKRVQFTPDMMPSDVVGTELIQEHAETGARELRFVPGPVFTNLLLADEVNRTPPRTQAALLEAMAERQVTAAGRSRPLDPPFVVVATQNPIEQEGTYPLPEAQLDRFMFSLRIDYPGHGEEQRIIEELPPDQRLTPTEAPTEPVLTKDQAVEAAGMIRRMPLSGHVRDYALALTRASRPGEGAAVELVDQYVAWGAGPRAGQYLVLAAKAWAAMAGEPTPSCDHVRRAAAAVLTHRLVMNFMASGEGVEAGDVVRALIEAVAEPRHG